MAGKRLIRTERLWQKSKAFVDTRLSDQFLLFARTDAIAVTGFDDAIERGNRYLEAGADVVFVEAPVSMEQAVDIPRLINGRVLYNWVYGGKSPLIHPAKLSELGYSYYYQADVLYAVSRALQSHFSELKTTGLAQTSMATFDEFNELIGLAEVVAAEQRYDAAHGTQ